MSEPSLSHLAEDGSARMVDVGDKPVVRREAVAEGFIRLLPGTVDLVRRDGLPKGDVLAVARVAGIQAAKLTQHLVPLCHQLPLSAVRVEFTVQAGGILATCTARTAARTGVEMEALTGVSLALLTIYDMCKAVDREMEISGVRLVAKTKESPEAH